MYNFVLVVLCTSTYWYILVCTGMYMYRQVYNGIYWYVYLWVHAMKAPLWQLERLASGTHYAPDSELLRLPLDIAKGCQGTINNMHLQNMIQLSCCPPWTWVSSHIETRVCWAWECWYQGAHNQPIVWCQPVHHTICQVQYSTYQYILVHTSTY